ncbi:MAG: T9SS type A sorting domain-containing protein [Sphingobacteriales bacterium]|nr:T9SS type A sorting domain-containing protein [Sphingobacteriales bacterium]
MKHIFLLFFVTLISLCSFSQGTQVGNLSINEYFTESFSSKGGTQILCVDNDNFFGTIAAGIQPKKFIPSFTQHKCGDMWVFNSDLNWGHPFVWQVNLKGTIYPYQLKNLVYSNSTIIVGLFSDSISIDSNTYYALDSNRTSSFILSLKGESGEFNWITIIQDSMYNSMATSVTELNSGNILVSTLHNDIESSIIKINANNGNVISTKYFPNVRTISSIEELNNIVYVAGSASDFANIDTFTVRTNLNTGYANFMFKADTSLNLNFLACEPYITFDFTSHLEARYSNIIWAFYKQNNSQVLTQSFNVYRDIDTLIERLSLPINSNFSEYENRLIIPTDMSGFLLFKRDGLDYNLYSLNFGSTSYFENITTGTTVEMYDVSTDFLETVVSGSFISDTLFLLNHQLLNPYYSANQTCDFMSFYHEIYGGIDGENKLKLKTYPNPANEEINIVAENVQYVTVVNAQGQLMNEYFLTNKIDIHQLPRGIYLLKGYTTEKQFSIKFIKK